MECNKRVSQNLSWMYKPSPPPFGTPCSKTKMWLTLYFRSDRALMVFTKKWVLFSIGDKTWEGIIKYCATHLFDLCPGEKKTRIRTLSPMDPSESWGTQHYIYRHRPFPLTLHNDVGQKKFDQHCFGFCFQDYYQPFGWLFRALHR